MRASFIKIDMVIIFFLTISLLSLRWVMSYVDFPDEGFVLRAIHEVYDSSYFPLIKSFSSLNFNPSYNPEIQNLNMISFPFLSLLPNIFFYKIFGIYSFLIIEFFSVFLFLLIFYKIFCSMKMSKISSLLFSLILFSIPHILQQLTFLNIDLIIEYWRQMKTGNKPQGAALVNLALEFIMLIDSSPNFEAKIKKVLYE